MSTAAPVHDDRGDEGRVRVASPPPDAGAASLGVTRQNLQARTLAHLGKPGARRADVLLVRDGSRRIVVKDYAARGVWMRRLVGPWLVRRELKAYARLEGVEAVPRALGRIDSCAFAIEYRPGRMMTQALRGELRPEFLDELRAAVAELHERGVLHGDLRHRSNVLEGRDGRPVILDLAAAVCLPRGGLAHRWLLPVLARLFDHTGLAKWQRKCGQPAPPSLGGDASPESDCSVPASAGSLGSRGASRPM